MTYCEDGAPYPFPSIEEPALCVGWLDASREFTSGPVAPEFVTVLNEFCRATVLRTRGWHYCNLCVRDSDRRSVADYVKTVVQSDRGHFAVGSAEIRVGGLHGVTYVAPDMVIHYVLEHGYRPPDEFIEAVLASR